MIPLADFRRQHLHRYVQRRVKQVSRNTANRDVAALRKMLSFAGKGKVIDSADGRFMSVLGAVSPIAVEPCGDQVILLQ